MFFQHSRILLFYFFEIAYMTSFNYHQYKNLFRLTPKKVGSHLRVFTVFNFLKLLEIRIGEVWPKSYILYLGLVFCVKEKHARFNTNKGRILKVKWWQITFGS